MRYGARGLFQEKDYDGQWSRSANQGDPEEYESLKLIEKAALTLLFVSETYGDSPPLGASCEWGGLRYQVEAIRKLAPDGTAVLSRVIVSR